MKRSLDDEPAANLWLPTAFATGLSIVLSLDKSTQVATQTFTPPTRKTRAPIEDIGAWKGAFEKKKTVEMFGENKKSKQLRQKRCSGHEPAAHLWLATALDTVLSIVLSLAESTQVATPLSRKTCAPIGAWKGAFEGGKTL